MNYRPFVLLFASLKTRLYTPLAGACLLVITTPVLAAPDTTWFGGTFWNADSVRWEAIQDSVWTFDSGVGSHFDHTAPYVNPFKDPSYHAYMEGWVGIDNTHYEVPYFRRLSASDFAGGTVCVGSTVGLGGDNSFWAGVLPGAVDDLCYVGGQGYGNDWFMCIERTFGYVSGSVALEYDFINDTEPGFDYTYVFVDTTGNDHDVRVIARTGITTGHAVHNLSQGTTLPVTSTGSVTIKFCAASDGAYSDEDGLYTTDCGAFAVDNISVTGEGLSHYANFETGDDGWVLTPSRPGVGGDWSQLVSVNDLPEPQTPYPCNFEDSVLVFIDDDGGHGWFQDNVAASPWIDLRGTGVSGRPVKIIETDIRMTMLFPHCVFAQFYVQWAPYTCPTSGHVGVSEWVFHSRRSASEEDYCTQNNAPLRVDVGDLIPIDAEQVRIAIGLWQYWDFYNCGGTTTAPWFDNVRFGVATDTAVVAVPDGISVPENIALAFEPNPLRSRRPGRISFTVTRRQSATVQILDIAGRLVSTVFEGTAEQGKNEVTWSGRNTAGQLVPSGVYFVRFAGEEGIVSSKLLVLQE